MQGSPMLNAKGQVVGIAFQGYDNINEFVPYCVFEKFLSLPTEVQPGELVSVPGVSFGWQPLENKAMFSYLGLNGLLGNNKSGIYVTFVVPFGSVSKVLLTGDVIVEVEGVSVGNLGTVLLESNRIGFEHLFTSMAIGDTVDVGIVRLGVRHDISWTLTSAVGAQLVPKCDQTTLRGHGPDYLVIGSLVFERLSENLLDCLYNRYTSFERVHAEGMIEFGHKHNAEHECVVIGSVLSHAVGAGYEGTEGQMVTCFNGISVNSLSHLVDLFGDCADEYVRLDVTSRNLPSVSKIVFNRQDVLAAEREILATYNIPSRSRMNGVLWTCPESEAEAEAEASVGGESKSGLVGQLTNLHEALQEVIPLLLKAKTTL
jgi:PDZ domain